MNSALEQELIDLDRQWNDAEARPKGERDVALLDRILVPEFISISEEGEVETKDAVLSGFASGDVRIECIACDQYTVRVYGDTAVMSHRAALKDTHRDQDMSSTYRITHRWVRRGTGRQIVASQKTCIAGEG
jgi:hypothetical protein